jgi:hypothetical protein
MLCMHRYKILTLGCFYVGMNSCICICIYIHTYIHIYIYIYMYAYMVNLDTGVLLYRVLQCLDERAVFDDTYVHTYKGRGQSEDEGRHKKRVLQAALQFIASKLYMFVYICEYMYIHIYIYIYIYMHIYIYIHIFVGIQIRLTILSAYILNTIFKCCLIYS